jgi:hypothetical protein
MHPGRAWLGTAVAAALVPASPAAANLITYDCGGLGAVAVVDEGPGDSDPAVGAIEHAFSCDVDTVGFAWHGEGTLVGVFGPPDSAQSEIVSLVIENTRGNVNPSTFRFGHVFETPLGPPPPLHSARLAGHFDNDSGTVNGALLFYSATVSNVSSELAVILSGVFPGDGVPVSGAAPIPFADADGGASLVAPISHEVLFTFYLDSPGDAVVFGDGEGFDVEAAPIPEPSTAALLAVGLGALAARARARAAAGRRRPRREAASR